MSPPVTTSSPFTLKRKNLRLLNMKLKRSFLKLSASSTMSSLRPGNVENSCETPLTLISVTAAPGSDDSKTRRKASRP